MVLLNENKDFAFNSCNYSSGLVDIIAHAQRHRA